MRKTLLLLSLISIVLSSAAPSQAAYIPPAFPSCEHPNGTVKVNYPQGEHAIVGVQGLQNGSDVVYSLGDENYMQCFCPIGASTGTQTNWLPAGSLSKDEINVLITQGWVFVQNGAGWGLSDQSYLAKNLSFSCNSGGSSTGGSAGSSSNNSSSGGGGGSTSNSGSSGGQGSQVLGISTLAATSSPLTKYQILASLMLGIALLVYGYKLQKSKK